MRKLEVRWTRSVTEERLVGVLAEVDHRMFFEYDASFVEEEASLSPFKLPLQVGLFEHTDRQFGSLPGLFDDSLPDGWGLLLMDRHFRREGLDPHTLSPLDRLAFLGTRTMGALTYHPPREMEGNRDEIDLYALGRNAEEVLAGDATEVLPELMRAGGSPQGARPKVLVGVGADRIISGEADLPDGFEFWMIKFAARDDVRDAGPIERAYALMADAAGIGMPETRLFEVTQGRDLRRYFGVRRFDRESGGRRIHMHTFANLIHANFRIPSTDYADLLKVTRILTRNHADVLRVFRQMAFNIAAHNRDDHGKNFAFLLPYGGEWALTPAYDLTFAPGPGGEHTMTVRGEGRHPSREHCMALAGDAGVRGREAESIFDEVNEAVAAWHRFADEACCSKRATSEAAAGHRIL